MSTWLEPLKPFLLGGFFVWLLMKDWQKANKFKCYEIKEWR